jgi:hypothetical protein
MLRTLVLSAMAVVVLSAVPSQAQRACLREDQIFSFDVIDDRTLIVEDNLHQKFKVSLLGYCNNLRFRNALGFQTVGGTGLSCITPGDNIINRGLNSWPQRCPVKSVVLYTPEMQKADEAAKAAKDAPPPPAPSQ